MVFDFDEQSKKSKGKYVIAYKTFDERQELFKALNEHGKTWWDNRPYVVEKNEKAFDPKMCIDVENGLEIELEVAKWREYDVIWWGEIESVKPKRKEGTKGLRRCAIITDDECATSCEGYFHCWTLKNDIPVGLVELDSGKVCFARTEDVTFID